MTVPQVPQDSFDYSNALNHCQTRLPPYSAISWCIFLNMDFLFTPWRYAYVTGHESSGGCLFCGILGHADDEKGMIVHRGKHCFVMLNAFPYTSGHVMVVPYQHTDQLQKLDAAAAAELM